LTISVVWPSSFSSQLRGPAAILAFHQSTSSFLLSTSHPAVLDFVAEHHRHPFFEEVPLNTRAFHASGS
jgi:hypothetical protein